MKLLLSSADHQLKTKTDICARAQACVWFPVVGDDHQPKLVRFYIPIIRIPVIKGGMSLAPMQGVEKDPDRNGSLEEYFPSPRHGKQQQKRRYKLLITSAQLRVTTRNVKSWQRKHHNIIIQNHRHNNNNHLGCEKQLVKFCHLFVFPCCGSFWSKFKPFERSMEPAMEVERRNSTESDHIDSLLD